MSDGPHLLKLAGHKKEWPVYLTIDNLYSKIHQMTSTHSVAMVALVPIRIKNDNISHKRLDEQWETTREVLNAVLWLLLQPPTFKHNPSAESGYYNVFCADGNFRRCKPVVAAWLAGCPEDGNLHHLERHVCFCCECSKNELGDHVPPYKQHRQQDHNLYQMLSDANSTQANAELSSRHVHRGFNVFQHIPCSASDLAKPDLLHTTQIGMLDHLQMWIFQFMRMHKWLDKYNAMWLSMPTYHDLTPKHKSYEEVSQWNGKEMN